MHEIKNIKVVTLRPFKGFDGVAPVLLPIRDISADFEPRGFLRAVTALDTKDIELMKRFADWRNRFQGFFLTQFETNAESMARWIESIVNDDHKILFRMEMLDFRVVGMIGFYVLGGGVFSFEAIKRGENSGGIPLGRLALISMLGFAFKITGLECSTGCHFGDNIPMTALCDNIGFRRTCEQPLFVTDTPEKVIYSVEPIDDNSVPSGRTLVTRELTRDEFFAKFPHEQ